MKLSLLIVGFILLFFGFTERRFFLALEQDLDVQASPPSSSSIFYLPPGSVEVSTVTQEQYRDLLNKFWSRYFLMTYKVMGRPLVMTSEWENPYFAAMAKNQGSMVQISLWGGMARAPGANLLILSTLLCHELGHFLGGDPKQSILGAEWATTEGQSDYYAASVCLPDFIKAFPEFMVPVSEEVRSKCGDDLSCQAILQAGWDTVRFLQRYSYRNFIPVSLTTKAPEVTELVRNSYPTDQCRLDTFVAASGCSSGNVCRPPACWLPKDQVKSK